MYCNRTVCCSRNDSAVPYREPHLARGATLPAFKLEIAGVVSFLMILVLLPQTFFMMQLARHGELPGYVLQTFLEQKYYGDAASHRRTVASEISATLSSRSLDRKGKQITHFELWGFSMADNKEQPRRNPL